MSEWSRNDDITIARLCEGLTVKCHQHRLDGDDYVFQAEDMVDPMGVESETWYPVARYAEDANAAERAAECWCRAHNRGWFEIEYGCEARLGYWPELAKKPTIFQGNGGKIAAALSAALLKAVTP